MQTVNKHKLLRTTIMMAFFFTMPINKMILISAA
jgi:hypothetical protein